VQAKKWLQENDEEEEAEIVGKTWTEMKVIAGNRVHWCCFTRSSMLQSGMKRNGQH
jgi:hypothetical protein